MMSKTKVTTHYTLRLPPEIRERAQQEADKKRWSLNVYITAAVEEKLQRDQEGRSDGQ